MRRKLLALLLAVVPASAEAGWSVAKSDHFVVYTQRGETSARDAAERLEKFQIALRFMTGTTETPSPARISVFLVADSAAVQATMPYGGGVAGYYSTVKRGAFAIMSRSNDGNGNGSKGDTAKDGLNAQQILFHELTHHFTFQYFPATYPVWYTEGFADYIGSMSIERGNVVSIGERVANRYRAFQMNDWLPVERLLTAKSYADVDNVGLLYAEGWLLVHYLSNANARPGQLKTYLTEVNKGRPYAQAATEAFGDLHKLDRELRDYSRRGALNAIVLPFKKLDPGPVEVRALSPAEDAMIDFEMQLYAGVPRAEVGAFADRVAKVAARYPDDVHALALNAEAQRLAGRAADAAATAEHWLRIAPNDGLALAAQADARSDMLVAARSTDPVQWREVRQIYGAAAKAMPDRPQILRGFYETYLRQGIMPPESAQNALYSAFTMLPQEDGLRHEVAADFERRGLLDAAIAVIRPAAFQMVDPSELSPRDRQKREQAKLKHKIAGDADDEETAREMLDRLEAKKAAKKPAG